MTKLFFIFTGTNAKETWDHMTRSHSNALKRKDKRSGSGATIDKEWKFEKDMMFLLPVKQLRNPYGNMPTSISDDCKCYFDDSQVSPQPQENTQDDNADIKTEILLPTADTSTNTFGHLFENSSRQMKRKHPFMDEDTNDINTITCIKQRQIEKSNDSPRLNFFRSMMPIIDKLNDDQFMNLQMDFIQAVQRQNNANSKIKINNKHFS